MKKRALALALAGAMTASLTACGTYQNSGTETTKAREQQERQRQQERLHLREK